MSRNVSLTWSLSLSFLAVALLVVLGYALLALSFFSKGLDSVTSSNLARSVHSFVAAMPEGNGRGLLEVNGLQIASSWENLPPEVRANLTPPLREGELYKYDLAHWPSPPKEFNFVMRVREGGREYYVRQRLTPETASPLVGRQMRETLRTLVGVSAVTLVGLCLFTWLIIRRVSRPARALAAWAASLNEGRLKEEPPDFFYPELNRLAGLVRNSLAAEHRSLERERLFLQYSSHELRTPISVVLASAELLHRIVDRRGGVRETEKDILRRIERAGQTMRHLVETLLWLGRDVSDLPPAGMVDLAAQMQEVINESQYLCAGRELDIVVETTPWAAVLPEAAVRIVLGNVVRNALQHTLRGIVHIRQSGCCVTVVNYMAREGDAAGDVGFGLGLELIERLTARLGWAYADRCFPGRHEVEVRFTPLGTGARILPLP